MDILFANKHLMHLCNDRKAARRAIGDEGAKKLRRRLDDLAAAADLSVMETLPGRFHGLKGDHKDHFALDLHQGWRLVFRPEPVPAPQLVAGGPDLARVTSVVITRVEDYHRG